MTHSSDLRFAPLTPLYPLRADEKREAGPSDKSRSSVRQFRFDRPHTSRSQPSGKASDAQESLSPLAASDSPRLLSMLALFFVGQALVVWAYFQANVNALGCGMVVSIAAVGLALQAQKRRRPTIAPSSFEPFADSPSPATSTNNSLTNRRKAASADSVG